MNKTINLSNGRVTYEESNAYCGKLVTIRRIYNDEKKHIEFNKWDDYSFKAYIMSENYYDLKELEFEIKQYDPLYLPLDKFLGEENQIIIDDDDSYETNENVMMIKKNHESIIIKFIDQRDKIDFCNEHFRVFIKNIGTDYRSKIDNNDYDTKERLYNLFNNFRKSLVDNSNDLTDNILEKTRVPNNQTKKM